MPGGELRPITLALLHEDAGLAVSLTDSHALAYFGRIELDASLLDEIHARTARVFGRPGSSRPDSVEGSAVPNELRSLGRVVFSRLFPEEVRSFLTRCPARSLYLQLSESLMPIPWESAFDGEITLGEKFRVSRRVVSDDEAEAPPKARPARDVLRALLILGAAPAEPYPKELATRLGFIEELCAKTEYARGLRRADALKLIGESDVVHYIGPAHGRGSDGEVHWWPSSEPISLRQIAQLPHPPQLLVSEHCAPCQPDASHALAKAACRSGLNILLRDCVPAATGSARFMLELYRELARGSALGEATRRATSVAGGPLASEGALRVESVLYGDCTAIPSPQRHGAAQEDHRRQVTMLSYDLVDSTKLIGTLGDEKYSLALPSCHARCKSIVARHGGVSDAHQGDDGIMCYFGFPVAYENSAAHAVHAALEIVDAVADLQVAVRVGIATGEVVVRAGQSYGLPIHIAARLRSAAEPGAVIVGVDTVEIVKKRFAFRELPALDLKGVAEPQVVYRVLGESETGAADWFEANRKRTPFVGREAERGRLEEHWAAARDGRLATVLVSGEAGIGKSRFVREFRRSISKSAQETIEIRCAPEHANSAYYPVIAFLRRLLRILDSDTVQSRLSKIGAFLRSRTKAADAPQLIADLLSIPSESRYPATKYKAERGRQLTSDLLVNLLCLEAEKAPLCLIVEDIQWVDPSTKELLHRLIARAARLPLLVVITERVGSKLTRNHGFDAAEIALKGLSSAATQKMIRGAGGDASLPGEVVRLLVEKADGVPLFIEESTRMLVEHRAAGGPASARSFTVPATIKDLLMTRLDQLSAAKQVAQLGGAIGREFPLALMQAVVAHESSPINTDDLASHLDTLVNSGLLIEKGEAPDTRYVFKHALVRDAAYESLLVSIRKSLHRTIALVIGEKFDDLAISQPELLAYHYTEAGMDPEALEYWEKAARLATSRSAHNEAISHLSSGLSVLSRLPEGSQRNCAELRLQLSLAGQLIATEGYGADRVERVYARASEVCRMVGDDAAMMKIQFGLEGYHFMRADFQKAHAIAVQAATMLRSPDPLRQLQARWAVANILFHQGELLSAVARMERCIEEYGNMKRRPTAVQDPGVMCLCYSAWGKWQLGYPEQALALASKAVALSEEMNHRFSMGEAFGFRTSVHHFRGESDEALACAERAIEICEDGGFAVWLAHAKLMRGRIVAERGDTAAGIEEMRRAYDMWTATGAVVTTPFYLALQAEGFALAGRPDDGLVLLQRAYDIVRKHGERYYEAEIMRLFGELTLQSAALRGIEASAEAERWFLGALESAQLRQLRSMMLRSATSLSRLRRTQGRAAEAYWVLASAFEWFQEGADTRDVRSARALLGELALTRASA